MFHQCNDISALGTAVFIAAYTVTDGMGVRLAGNVLTYVAWLTVLDGFPMLCIAVGRNGADISADGGQHWRRAGDTPYQAIALASDGSLGFAVGAAGAVAAVSRE